ncbi:MAG: HAD family hydrolase [Planctomycetia bacterium]|nr:HAD family hydrolase [Planctomycetia bacterium]MCC7316834.1 HAD family hydrolase [Planctomycetota bacterium]OQZ05547.1 MAG: sulfotransferase family protein [Planctomycetes bacterium UTPLA1]
MPVEHRIAMWSGPRNISTAMMRAWGSRGDTVVCDEPLYAHYLKLTGRDHPGAEEIVAQCETDWRKVIGQLTGAIPDGKAIYYQKHMAHHLLPGMDRDWALKLSNCFLIREPSAMLASLVKVIPFPGVEETGLPQQIELFDMIVAATGSEPPVIFARDVLENPAGMLAALCEQLGVPFSDAMLRWEPGPRATDGIWGKHWYANVEKSTGFEPYAEKDISPPSHLRSVLEKCERLFERLFAKRLAPSTTKLPK